MNSEHEQLNICMDDYPLEAIPKNVHRKRDYCIFELLGKKYFISRFWPDGAKPKPIKGCQARARGRDRMRGMDSRIVIPFPPDRIKRYVSVTYENDTGAIKKLFVRLPGQTEWKQWVLYDDPSGDGDFWGPADLF